MKSAWKWVRKTWRMWRPEFFRVRHVLLDIALGVDDDRGRGGLVSEQVGGVGEAAEIVLFEDHSEACQKKNRRARLNCIPSDVLGWQ